MFTFIVMYTIAYTLILTLILIFVRLYNINTNLSQYSFNVLWQNLGTYVSNTWTIKWLFFQLTGLPPVFIFFLKFDILFAVMRHASFILQLLVFLNLLLGMLFYAQIFTVTAKLYPSFFFKSFVKNNTIISRNDIVHTNKHYFFYNITHSFLFISFCSFLFFFDFFVIVRSIIF